MPERHIRSSAEQGYLAHKWVDSTLRSRLHHIYPVSELESPLPFARYNLTPTSRETFTGYDWEEINGTLAIDVLAGRTAFFAFFGIPLNDLPAGLTQKVEFLYARQIYYGLQAGQKYQTAENETEKAALWDRMKLADDLIRKLSGRGKAEAATKGYDDLWVYPGVALIKRGIAAENLLAHLNQALVYQANNRFGQDDFDNHHQDHTQIDAIDLILVARFYNPFHESKASFATYATSSLPAGNRDKKLLQARLYVPEAMQKKIRTLGRVTETYMQEYGLSQTPGSEDYAFHEQVVAAGIVELSEATQSQLAQNPNSHKIHRLIARKLEKIQTYANRQNVFSFDESRRAAWGEGGDQENDAYDAAGSAQLNTIPDPEAEKAFQQVDIVDELQRIWEKAQLDERTQEILIRRYAGEQTYREIKESLNNLSIERIRQKEAGGLRDLRRANRKLYYEALYGRHQKKTAEAED